ncbi:MAG TPA: molybdopterin-dependent oxidoreductase [Acidimicrobiia bacterium]|nr:molybdopterin-dependent oxidoreductase [Acidimicrobiia bacterium]
MSRTVHTFCRICVSACGLDVTVSDDNRVERIGPDKQNPHTWRDFCAKARTAAELVEHPRRILTPMRRVGDRYVEAGWDEAVGDIAARLRRIVDRHGPDAVGVYWGNPAGFSSSNLMFLTGWMDGLRTRSRYYVGSVDQNNYHVVSEALYGSPLVILPPDVDECRCFLLVGMNPAVSAMNWLENVPDGWRRILAAQQAGADLIVVDPLRTPTTDRADTHVAIRPGGDWAFLLGLLKVIFENGWEHRADCAAVTGLEHVRALAGEADLADLSAKCDVPVAVIVDVARRFAQAPTAVCLSHTGVSQHTTGTIGEWMAHLLNIVTGRLDRPGGRRFERGYVDTVRLFGLVAKPVEGRSRVRGLPAVAGHRALAELPDEILTPGPGRIRAMVLDCGNPVVSGPDGAALDRALASLDLLVAVDLVQRESHRHAHWLIPAAHWLERSDLMPLVSQAQDQPFAQYGRRAVEPPAGVREEWEFFVALAAAMKVPLFGVRGVNPFIAATRTAARWTGRPGLAFHPEWIDALLVRTGRRLKLKDIKAAEHGIVFGRKEYGHLRSALRTPDRRVHYGSEALLAEARRRVAEPPPAAPAGFPLLLSNRRHRHSMNSWLNELPGLHPQRRGSVVEIHPADAAGLGITSGDNVRVVSATGEIEVEAEVSDGARPGVVVLAHGWGSRVFDPRGGGEPVAHGVNRNLLVTGAEIDPLSQISPLNSTWVRVEPAGPAAGTK